MTAKNTSGSGSNRRVKRRRKALWEVVRAVRTALPPFKPALRTLGKVHPPQPASDKMEATLLKVTLLSTARMWKWVSASSDPLCKAKGSTSSLRYSLQATGSRFRRKWSNATWLTLRSASVPNRNREGKLSGKWQEVSQRLLGPQLKKDGPELSYRSFESKEEVTDNSPPTFNAFEVVVFQPSDVLRCGPNPQAHLYWPFSYPTHAASPYAWLSGYTTAAGRRFAVFLPRPTILCYLAPALPPSTGPAPIPSTTLPPPVWAAHPVSSAPAWRLFPKIMTQLITQPNLLEATRMACGTHVSLWTVATGRCPWGITL